MLALLASLAEPARADGPSTDPKELSRQRYQEGAAAYAAGSYMDAIERFLEANRLSPNPAFAYNIGLAYEELGDAPDALKWYRAYLRALPAAPDRAEIEPKIVQAEQRLLARGVQQATILSTPDGATITLDGRRVGVTPWSGEMPPGAHQVSLELRGYLDAATSFELPADRAVDVSLKLQVEPLHPIVPVSVPVAEASVQRVRRITPVTWSALGVGVAGLGAALGFEFARAAAVSSAKSETNVEGKDRYDEATTYQTISRVSLGVGSAFAVAGGVLLYFDLWKRGATDVTAACSGPSCGVEVHGAF